MLAVFLPVFVTPDWNFSTILVLLSSWKLMLGDSHEHPSHHLPYRAITKNCYLTVWWLIAPNTVPSSNQTVCAGFRAIAEMDTAGKTLPATENWIYLRLPTLDFSVIRFSWLWQLLGKLKFPFRHQSSAEIHCYCLEHDLHIACSIFVRATFKSFLSCMLKILAHSLL